MIQQEAIGIRPVTELLLIFVELEESAAISGNPDLGICHGNTRNVARLTRERSRKIGTAIR
jgi:hypothetical protein